MIVGMGLLLVRARAFPVYLHSFVMNVFLSIEVRLAILVGKAYSAMGILQGT